MTTIRDIILAKQQQAAGTAKFQKVVKAYMTDIETTNDPRVVGRPGFVWVREYGANGGVHQAFNPGVVRPGVNAAVKIGYDEREPWRWIVLGVDWELIIYDPDYDPNDPMLGLHAPTHEWPDGDPGPDPVFVHPRAFWPLHVYPGSSGLTVSVGPLRYEHNGESVYYPGVTDMSIASLLPSSGNKNVILIYLDANSNEATAVGGTAVPDVDAIPLQYPDYPVDSIAAAYVILTSTHTAIVELDIEYANQMLHASNTAGSGVVNVATSIGQVLYSIDGETFTAQQPVVDNGYWIEDDGVLIVT